MRSRVIGASWPVVLLFIMGELDIISSIGKVAKMSVVHILRALANERRLQILEWLRDPRAHFPPQVDGDLVEDGVCGVLIAEKLRVSAPTLSEHMRILVAARLVQAKRIKGWTMYRRDEAQIAAAKCAIEDHL
jgi:ArsR family transcriptional regulator